MSFGEWVAVILGVISICGSFAVFIRWLVKTYLSELKPDQNGGHNLEGRITRLESTQARIEARIDQILFHLQSK